MKILDDLLRNKYFCIAILIALVVLLYLYSQKQSCDIEPMSNIGIDFSTLSPELTENPWTESGDDHKQVGNKFDIMADNRTRSKLKSDGHLYRKFLKRTDQNYEQYGREDFGYNAPVPKPLDTHPELSQCQPCRCDRNDKLSKILDSASDGDTESESETEVKPKPKKKHYK